MSPGRRGFLLTAGAYLIWGLLPLYWKLLAAWPAPFVLCQRMVWAFATLALLLLVRSPGRFMVILQRLGRWDRGLALQLLAGLLIGCNWLIFIWAVNEGHVLEVSLGYFINPLVTVLLGRLVLGEHLNRAKQVAVALAGVAIVILMLRMEHIPWVALSLATTFGFYGLLKKRTPFSSLDGMWLETALLLPLALAALALMPVPHVDHNAATALLLVSTGAATVLPLLLFGAGVKALDLSTVGLIHYLAPSVQFLLALWVFREPLRIEQLLGFVLIWVGLAVYSLDTLHRAHARRRTAREPA